MIEAIVDSAMHNFELVIIGVVVGYAAGAMMTKRKMRRGMGMGGMGM